MLVLGGDEKSEGVGDSGRRVAIFIPSREIPDRCIIGAETNLLSAQLVDACARCMQFGLPSPFPASFGGALSERLHAEVYPIGAQTPTTTERNAELQQYKVVALAPVAQYLSLAYSVCVSSRVVKDLHCGESGPADLPVQAG